MSASLFASISVVKSFMEASINQEEGSGRKKEANYENTRPFSSLLALRFCFTVFVFAQTRVWRADQSKYQRWYQHLTEIPAAVGSILSVPGRQSLGAKMELYRIINCQAHS